MSSGLIVGGITVVLLVLIAALIAAGETALTRISHARAESLATEDLPGAGALADVLTDREGSLAPLLLLRVIFHFVAATIVAAIVIDRAGTGWVVAAVVVEVTAIHVLAEAMPRTWALQHPDTAARRAAPVVRVVLLIAPLRWASRALNGMANALRRVKQKALSGTLKKSRLRSVCWKYLFGLMGPYDGALALQESVPATQNPRASPAR